MTDVRCDDCPASGGRFDRIERKVDHLTDQLNIVSAVGPRLDRLVVKVDALTHQVTTVATDLAVLTSQISHILAIESMLRTVENWLYRGLGAIAVLSVVISLAANAWL